MCRKPKGLRGKYCDLLSGVLRKIRATILTSSLLKQARLFDCDFSFHCEAMFLRGEEMKTQEPEFDARIHSEFPEVKFMRKAISLAKKGEGFTNPNPLVGAVIEKNGKILACGFHHKYGELHAERDALLNLAKKNLLDEAKGATLYVTLEPCCHFGKQPPCVQAILEAGISKVIVGSRDPNPIVAGKGIKFLRENGVQVYEDFLRDECDALNFIFFHFVTKKIPFVALKYAMTADGKIATVAGKSKWISCDASREYAHILRKKYACILCGIGTVLADDPLLTCRIKGGKDPVRVICDSNLRIPLDSKIVRTAKEVPTIVACALDEKTLKNERGENFDEKISALENAGIEILFCKKHAIKNSPSKKQDGSEIDLKRLMKLLAKKNLDSVLIEGGAKINFSALKAGIVQRVYCFVAPKIFGGANAPSPVGGEGVQLVSRNFTLERKSIAQCGDDIILEYEVQRKS